MKRLEKRYFLQVLTGTLAAACLLSGCAKENDNPRQNENGTGMEQDVVKVDMEEEWQDMPEPETDSEEREEIPAPEESRELQSERNLSDEELLAFTRFVTEDDGRGNYGFLLSVYDAPQKVNLDEVFYTGAGIATEPLSEEEKQDFLKATGSEEIYTDVIRLTTAQIDEFLLRRTGLSYEQMEQPLEWVYLPKYDAYYHEAGDTNYTAYTCVGGTTDEKYFKLRFQKNDSMAEGAYHEIDTETVLEKTEEGYRFISNRLMTEEGLIEDQTFQTNVANFGEVTVAAYEPGTEGETTADVTFVMLKDGQVISYLQGMEPENIRSSLFNKVECVSFPDYNRDGYTDMIAICSYFRGAGPDAGKEYREARIYSGNEWGYFYLEEELSQNTNSALAELSIESVMGFLGYDR